MSAANSQQQSNEAAPPPPPDKKPPFDEHAAMGTLQALHGHIARWRPQITALAPSGFKVERFEAIVMSCVARTPKLLGCSYFSLAQSIRSAAEMGLDLGGVSGEAYLIPYENRKKIGENWIAVLEAQFMAGYKGYIRLAHESGLFRSFFALPILTTDEFDPPARGPNGVTWAHRENPFAKLETMEIEGKKWVDRKQVTFKAHVPALKGAYAVAQLHSAKQDDIIRVVPAWRLEEIRLRSKAGSDGPWITDYAEMAAKTAVRAIWKQLPKSDRMKKLEELDDDVVVDMRVEDVTPTTNQLPVQTSDRGKAKIDKVAESVAKKAEQQRAQPPVDPQASDAKGGA